ncbi:MAG: hypothetical protein PVI30_18045 [Myxococcales bacterium]|jgi:hypothetical protein
MAEELPKPPGWLDGSESASSSVPPEPAWPAVLLGAPLLASDREVLGLESPPPAQPQTIESALTHTPTHTRISLLLCNVGTLY